MNKAQQGEVVMHQLLGRLMAWVDRKLRRRKARPPIMFVRGYAEDGALVEAWLVFPHPRRDRRVLYQLFRWHCWRCRVYTRSAN